MRFFIALALFVLGVANAHHSPQHQLANPGYIVGKTHLYDVMINMTAGVPGLSPQVSKAVIQTELKIYAKSEKELIIQMHKVRVSNSLAEVGSATDEVTLHPDSKLEEYLKVPTLATIENGLIKSYTLSPRESLESQKIKRSILRNLEIYLDKQYLHGGSEHMWPITYNVTRTSPGGNYSSHYVVTSSPYPDFPKELNVFNISRTDNYEVVPYLAYKSHHNFAKQGCPEVCKKDHIENRFGAGCPIEHEPYQTPMKRSFVQHHNLRILKTGTLIIDSVHTKETHVADVYDQHMEVTIRTHMKFNKAVGEKIPDPTGQQIHTDLNDLSKEINEEEIEEMCKYPDTSAAIEEVKRLLDLVADIVLSDDMKDEKSKQVGEILISMQKALQMLKEGDLRTVQRSIVNYDEMEHASVKDKVKRQIWLDLLPVIGTSESVSFIVHLITENMNLPNKAISLWESRTILEALPTNIHRPNEQTINELSRLLEILKDRQTPGYTIFYSAAHMAVARVIRNLCAVTKGTPEDTDREEPRSFRYLQRNLRSMKQEDDNEYKHNMARECPKVAVKRFIEQISRQLKSTEDKSKRVIYIETLARTGLEEVLPILRPYVNGQEEKTTRSSTLSQSYIDFLKTVAIHALHNVVEKSPRAVQELVLPAFTNRTEPPKVRIAAFGVVIQSQPTLGLLQHIAELSWTEPSEEVASYVTSSLQTIGNSSLPCHQLTALRIKKVLPQMKRSEHGHQKAKNGLWDLWDEVRGFGFEKRFGFTPSNESFIPSSVYGSLGYNADTLKDYFFQYAFNVQGLTSRNLYDALLIRLGLSPAEDIPKEKENTIFSGLNIVARDPEFWRFIAYEKLFYSTSYYYFDAEDTSRQDVLDIIIDQLTHYITRDSQGNLNGHLIKVYIPSSYHAKTISQSLPYPVQFQMKNPLLISMKVKVQHTSSSGFGLELHLSPSVYYSTVYTNEIMNLGDCKKVGVYHEKKTALSYPVVITVNVRGDRNVSLSYKFPELPKHVFTYRSEAGTYAGKNYLQPLPSGEDRRTIETLPSQFVKPISWGLIGLPKFQGEIKSEDIQTGMEDIPRNAEEATLYAVRHFLNAGWRRKSVDISRVPDSILWTPQTEVKLHLNYTRDFVSHKSSEFDWSKDLKFDDKLEKEDPSAYESEGQKIHEKLSKSLSHIKDVVTVKVEQITNSAVHSRADLTLQYSHTLGGFLHVVRVNGSAAMPGLLPKLSMTTDYAIAFIQRPNEFKYSNDYGKQKALALGAISFSSSAPFTNPSMIAKAVFNYTPLDKALHMSPPLSPKEVEPETHEECLNDVKNGESLSVACLKAMREKSIFNNMKLHAVWMKELPLPVRELAEKVDLALKHTYYSHMEITKKQLLSKCEKVQFHHLILESTYIDKMTDEPVVDFVLDKPSEIVRFSKIRTGKAQPLSSIETLAQSYAASMTNNSYPSTCAMSDKTVRTFDLKTYPLPRDTPSCSYVLSTHCTEYKKFAVLVKHSPDAAGTQEVHIHVGKDTIVLVPGSKFSYKIKYNEQEQEVRVLSPLMLSEPSSITALVNIANDGTSFVEINARKAGILVRYNGVNVKVQVHPRYKGELCGLCSEFNGEVVREFRGVDRCLYTNAGDFAKSSIVGSCTDKTPVYPFICNNDEVSYTQRRRSEQRESDEVERRETSLKRNAVLARGNEICFSIKPVPVCENNADPSRTESREIDFHCLPKQDVNARKMVIESKRRILGELETKTVDRTETIEVAKMC